MTGTTLNQRLESILLFLEESIKTGAEFAKDQAPDVVNQLLAWRFAEAISFSIFSLLLTILFLIAARKLWKGGSDSEAYDPSGWYLYSFLMYFATFGAFTLSIASAMDAMKIAIAPKVFLLEYASSLLK